MPYSNKDSGFGDIVAPIAIFFSVMLIGVILGRSIAPTREVIVENGSLTSYIEAAEKLKLSYEVKNSGDKKKIIISFSK